MKLFRTFSKNSPSQDMTLSFVTFVMLPREFLRPGQEIIFSGLVAKTAVSTPFPT